MTPGRFVPDFLLPLVRGGALHVGRPLGAAAVRRVLESARRLAAAPAGGADPVRALARARAEVIGRFLPAAAVPPLDETTVRLGAALHDLLALGHPDLVGPGLGRRQERIAAAARGLAAVGPPRTAAEAVARHSLLGRMGEIIRVDRTVRFWLGRQTFVGRTPPPRITAMPGLRRVRVEQAARVWLREIGIPGPGRVAFVELNAASPLGEALDPLRLDPPPGWGRMLSVIRFPALARVVAGASLDLGVERAGDALAAALYRYVSLHDPPVGLRPSGDGAAFALGFLAHLVWLDVLFRAEGRRGTVERPAGAGLELAVVLTAAERTRPQLVWPDDVPVDGDLGRAFRARLDGYAAQAAAAGSPRLVAAMSIADFAVSPVTRPVAVS
ncbi:MAG TPA: hypothetical protein VHH90_05030 [Polyangia bacterium]|nr:hypothetical protein [Polyangia bacterium]